ncbi:MFS general substrate transporter [Patellaria atrata CBS 101060]|uniref:Probable transporter MCH1 n=1 Tax=Patellaria atrata CBS 101060 TaxID=1346257 RepID=A0A9P4SHD1_9PEZI|nr:MFS general substrate transporter [Patellaria atrata CBS 101060]
MPSNSNGNNSNQIDKLDYTRPHERQPLLQTDDHGNHDGGRSSHDNSYAGSFFEQVAEGIQERDLRKMKTVVRRYLSFIWAVVNCLCAGSITAYSLYGHIFQSRLHYTQFQINIVAIVAEIGMYVIVPAVGYLCDRYGPGWPSLFSAFLFGAGYTLAGLTYRTGSPPSRGGDGWPFSLMVVAFAAVGLGTCCMYLSAVTTCVKNFGRGKYKGVALAIPIAAFGLSGMWQSQVGSKLLYERNPDGSKGDVDVFRYFLFLACTLFAVGIVGFFTLVIIDEEEMIDEAVDQLEQSGLLQEDEFFQRAASIHGYGTTAPHDLSDSTFDFLRSEADDLKAKAEEERRKKNWLLNEETRLFLADRTMWWLAAGFFLVTGPGEAFINNLGTVIETLYPPSTPLSDAPTTAATHVSIVAITSTLARLITGTLSDLLAPVAPQHQHRRLLTSMSSSIDSLAIPPLCKRFTLSRVTFLLVSALFVSIGQAILASGVTQDHVSRFWLVSGFIGAGYGAVFSLVPIVISVVWGVENFGTNWGIVAMVPAAGAAVWGLLYSAVYQRAAHDEVENVGSGVQGRKEDILCYGKACYQSTFWAMVASVWIACGLWMWAWRGPGGWKRRGIAV